MSKIDRKPVSHRVESEVIRINNLTVDLGPIDVEVYVNDTPVDIEVEACAQTRVPLTMKDIKQISTEHLTILKLWVTDILHDRGGQ